MKLFWKLTFITLAISMLALYVGFIFFLNSYGQTKENINLIINETTNGSLPSNYLQYSYDNPKINRTNSYIPIVIRND